MVSRKVDSKQSSLTFTDADFQEFAGQLDRAQYYPCSEVIAGDGAYGPHQVAKKQAQALRKAKLPSVNSVNGNGIGPRSGDALRFEDKGDKITLRGTPSPEGVPMYLDKRLERLSTDERRLMIIDFLKWQNLILNREGGMRVCGGENLSDQVIRRQRAIATLDGLYYHFPFQTLTVLFQVLPGKAGQISSRGPVVDPRDTQWEDITLAWVKEYKHTRGEFQDWIRKINDIQHSTSGKPPRNAKRIADYVARHMGFTPTDEDGYRPIQGVPTVAFRRP